MTTQKTTAKTPTMDNTQLTAWLVNAGLGNQSAFENLAQALGQRMFALAYRLMNNNPTAAEDVVQDVMIKLWVNAPKWEVGGSVAAYASRLIYTTSMDQHRKAKPEDDITDMEIASVAESAYEKVELLDTRSQLMKGISSLPSRQQEAVLLSYFHEHKQKEIAHIMQTTEKAVESLLIRARRSLADVLPTELKQGLAA